MPDKKLLVIELDKKALFATQKLFNVLTKPALLELGFSESEVDSLGELYLEVKDRIEVLDWEE